MAVAKSEKPGMFTRVKRYFRSMVQEMKKVHWPGRRDLIIYTVVVVCASLAIALAIWLMDSFISVIFSYVFGI